MHPPGRRRQRGCCNRPVDSLVGATGRAAPCCSCGHRPRPFGFVPTIHLDPPGLPTWRVLFRSIGIEITAEHVLHAIYTLMVLFLASAARHCLVHGKHSMERELPVRRARHDRNRKRGGHLLRANVPSGRGMVRAAPASIVRALHREQENAHTKEPLADTISGRNVERSIPGRFLTSLGNGARLW